MAITTKQNEDLQKQYDVLRSQGQTKEQATGNIKSTLQKTVVESPTTSGTAYDQLKSSYQSGGVDQKIKGNLDITNQYRSKLGTGPVLEHTTTAQPPIGTVSNVSGGFSNLKEVTPIVPKIETTIGAPLVTGVPKIDTPQATTPTGYDTGAPVLDTELTQIQKDKNKAIEEQKKSFLLGKSQFEKNKAYYSNYDVLDKQYTGVVNDLITAGGDTGVVPEAKYQEIANKYGITLEEAKDPNSILKRGILTDEGKKVLGVSKAESDLEQARINNERKKEDLKIQLENTLTGIDQQVEDLGKQMARNVGWTEAMGAWSGALRGSGYLQGIQNIKDDATTTINRLKAQAERIKTANEKDVARLTEDFNKSYAFAKDELDKQVNDLKTNNILKLNEAQATYGLGSSKLKDVLDGINKEYGLKANESVTAYLKNLSAINSIAKENMNLIEESDKLAETKANKQFNAYLANGGANMMNTTFNTLAQDVLDGKMTVEKAQSMKNIMLSSIQATLGKISPVSTQDLFTVNTLLSQGFTPSEVVAQMQSLAKFQPKATIEKTIDLGNYVRVQYSDGTTEDIGKGTEQMTPYQKAQIDLSREKEGLPPIVTVSNIPSGVSGNQNYNESLLKFTADQQSARTNRHNNPTAFTTTIAKQGGLVEGVDYIAGDSFGEKGQYKTAMLLGNPIDATIKVIDNIGFKTQGGANRWTYTDSLGLSNEKWKSMTYDQKVQAIGEMYKNETDNKYENFNAFLSNKGEAPNEQPQQTQTELTPYQNLTLSSYDGKDIGNLAKNLGVDRETAKAMYDSYKNDNVLSDYDTGVLASYLKDISGTAVAKPEYDRQEKRFLSMRKSGMTTQEIMNQLGGYVPTPENKDNQSVKNQLAELQPYVLSLGVDASKKIGSLINQGNFKKAVQELEAITYKQKGIDSESVSDAGAMIKKGNALKDKIKEYEGKFGPIQQWATKTSLLFNDDPAVQGLMADMTGFISKYRNDISGSTVTASESEALAPLLASIKDNPQNAMAKIESMQRAMVDNINTSRDQSGLPQLKDWRSFYDIDFRNQAYKGKQLEQKTAPTVGRWQSKK